MGANAILGVSLAVAKAAADESGQPLYRHGSQKELLIAVRQANCFFACLAAPGQANLAW